MMKRFAVVFALFALSACADNAQAPGSKASSAASGEYVAKIGDVKFAMKDIVDEYNLLPTEVQEFFSSQGKGLEGLAEELIKREVLYQEAKKKGLDKTDEFKKKINNYEKRLLVETLLDQALTQPEPVSDQAAREFYDKNPDNFTGEPTTKGGKTKKIEFEKVKDVIRQYLQAEQQKKAFDDYIESVKKTYAVEFRREAFTAAEPAVPGAPEAAPEGGDAPNLKMEEPKQETAK